MKNKKLKKWIIVILVIVVLIVLVVSCNVMNVKKLQTAQFDVSPATAEATVDDIKVYISASGVINTGEEIAVASGTQGKVTQVLFNQGDFVKNGDVIATVEADTLDDQITELETQIAVHQDSIDLVSHTSETYTIKSPVKGRVREVKPRFLDSYKVDFALTANNDDDEDNDVEIYFQEIEDLMKKHGYLAGIAVGDFMYVMTSDNINQYEVNQEVEVIVNDYNNTKYSYKVYVDKIENGKAYIVIPTTWQNADLEATIYSKDDVELGKGKTEFYDYVYIKGDSGQIRATNTVVGERISVGEVLYTVYTPTSSKIKELYADLKKMEEDLLELKEMRNNSNIVAPYDGYITTLNLSQGMNVTEDEIAFKIADTALWNATVAVDELDINQVKEGMKATVSIDAIVDEEFEGTVSKISSFGENSSGVTTYDVTIELSADEQFKLSMNASAEILVDEAKDIITIPTEAVKTVGDTSFVMIYTERNKEELENIKADILQRQSLEAMKTYNKDMAKELELDNELTQEEQQLYEELTVADQLYGIKVEVEIGIQNETIIEIKSGLNEGDVVLLPVSDASDFMDDFESMMGSGGGPVR